MRKQKDLEFKVILDYLDNKFETSLRYNETLSLKERREKKELAP